MSKVSADGDDRQAVGRSAIITWPPITQLNSLVVSTAALGGPRRGRRCSHQGRSLHPTVATAGCDNPWPKQPAGVSQVPLRLSPTLGGRGQRHGEVATTVAAAGEVASGLSVRPRPR